MPNSNENQVDKSALMLFGQDPQKPCKIGVITPIKPNYNSGCGGANLAENKFQFLQQIRKGLKDTTPWKFSYNEGVILLPNHRFSTTKQHPLYWDRPACAITTQAFADSPTQYFILLEDTIHMGGTAAAINHAITQAGKHLLCVCAFRLDDYPFLHQTPELKAQLDNIFSYESKNRQKADAMLDKLGISFETLTGRELNHMLNHPIRKYSYPARDADELVRILAKEVDGALDQYYVPDRLEFLRYLHERKLELSSASKALLI